MFFYAKRLKKIPRLIFTCLAKSSNTFDSIKQNKNWHLFCSKMMKWCCFSLFCIFWCLSNNSKCWPTKTSLFLPTHPWHLSKSKFNLNSDRVNLVAPASPILCLLYLPNVRAIQYKLGPERLTRLGNSNVYYGCPWCDYFFSTRMLSCSTHDKLHELRWSTFWY